MKMNKLSAKKRIMYLSGEDFYLYCYSIFIILDSLSCCNEKYFRDYRKLAFLIDLINEDILVYIVCVAGNKNIGSKDRQSLFDSYSAGLTKRSETLKLIFVLEKKGYLTLKRGASNEIDLTLNKELLPNDFVNSQLFKNDRENIKKLSKKIKRLGSLKLDTMLDRIFSDNGIKTWG